MTYPELEAQAEALTQAYRMQLDPEHPAAARIWADLARVCHAGETTHVPGNSHDTAFREGQRSVFLYMAGYVNLPLTPTR